MDWWKHPKRPDELYHWATPKNHRYIAKIGEGKDARYFYTQEELQAYKNEKNNVSKTERTANLINYQYAHNGYRGKDKPIGEVKFHRGEQRGMTKEDVEEHRKYLNSDDMKKYIKSVHDEEAEEDKDILKKAEKIANKREKKAREKYGHTREDMTIREKDARMEERGPRVSKAKFQGVNEARREQTHERNYKGRASREQTKENRLNESGPRVSKIRSQSASEAKSEQVSNNRDRRVQSRERVKRNNKENRLRDYEPGLSSKEKAEKEYNESTRRSKAFISKKLSESKKKQDRKRRSVK